MRFSGVKRIGLPSTSIHEVKIRTTSLQDPYWSDLIDCLEALFNIRLPVRVIMRRLLRRDPGALTLPIWVLHDHGNSFSNLLERFHMPQCGRKPRFATLKLKDLIYSSQKAYPAYSSYINLSVM